jgi:hypothetical protein
MFQKPSVQVMIGLSKGPRVVGSSCTKQNGFILTAYSSRFAGFL